MESFDGGDVFGKRNGPKRASNDVAGLRKSDSNTARKSPICVLRSDGPNCAENDTRKDEDILIGGVPDAD